ncbi:hypothetical protein RHGRI_005661 [Rhododendron griersonianum]|uniref:Retrotransposon gag domain-containing protein n=1 Tax=Rhododendron griersonianum TaxID=479676 RepID=A0AAV6LD53_9ERIC|nr:hypothetical protein RHGRI_005661 [Rhododendron griersonianum]
MEFRQVPEDRRVSLVATRFRGRAAAWWQQLKLSRTRQEVRNHVPVERKNNEDAAIFKEEFDEIFFNTNTFSLESQIDWDLPPKFDENVDEEFEDCEANIIEDVHVAIQGVRKYDFMGENDSKISPLPIVVNGMHIPIFNIKLSKDQMEGNCAFNCTPTGISTAPKEVTPILVNGSCIVFGSDIPSIIRCTNSTLTSEFSFQDGKAAEGGEIGWGKQFADPFWKYIKAVKKNIWIAYLDKIGKQIVTFICQESSLQVGFEKINLKYKNDANMFGEFNCINSRASFFKPGRMMQNENMTNIY